MKLETENSIIHSSNSLKSHILLVRYRTRSTLSFSLIDNPNFNIHTEGSNRYLNGIDFKIDEP